VILGEDVTVSSVDGKHILIQSLDEVKGESIIFYFCPRDFVEAKFPLDELT
jgi:hypothetical protein